MEIKEIHKNDFTIFQIMGELGLENSEQLWTLAKKKINDKNRNIALDFNNVSFINSVGIGTIVMIRKKLKDYKGKLVLFNLIKRVSQSIYMTHLDRTITIVENEEDVFSI